MCNKKRSWWCLMMEGCGSGTGSGPVLMTNGSGRGSRRPKNIWIPRIRIRIHNTSYKGADGTGKLPWRGHVWPQSRARILLALIWTAQEPSQERTKLASVSEYHRLESIDWRWPLFWVHPIMMVFSAQLAEGGSPSPPHHFTLSTPSTWVIHFTPSTPFPARSTRYSYPNLN